MDESFLEFKQADLIKFRRLVSSLGFYYEEGFWLTLHKLVRSRRRFLDELEVRRNQSTLSHEFVAWKAG